MIRRLYKFYTREKHKIRIREQLKAYISGGRVPWSKGYLIFRNKFIKEQNANPSLLKSLKAGKLPEGYGKNLDERVVEYPWVISQITKNDKRILDAGSTFNYDFVMSGIDLSEKELSILTYAPESPNYNEKRISYVYADLREIPFRENYFDTVISMSTIEHIDMDNSIYGYDLSSTVENGTKSYEYLKALSEMIRVLKPSGKLIVTVPYGAYEHHGFFQQFDKEMIQRASDLLSASGNVEVTHFQYKDDQWNAATQVECNKSQSYNPHTGAGKGEDGAAHSRAIACISLIKK